jgi:hypothetical protein
MAEFVSPQFNNPDLLGAAPIELAGAQQDQQYRGLQMDQLRQTMAQQGLIQSYARQLAGQPGAPGAPGAAGQQPQGAQPAQADPTGQSGGGYQSPNVNTMMALDVLQGRDPLKSAQYAQQNVMEQKKLQLQGPMNLAERVATDPQANIVIANNPQLLQQWKGWAQQHGLNPADPTALTVQNAQRAASDYHAQLSAQVGEAPKDFGFSGTLKPGEAAYKGGQMVAGSPDAVTPYQHQEMQLRQQEFALANQRFAFEQNKDKIPSGYENDPAKPGALRPIEGGPKDPNAVVAGGLGGRDGVMFQRVTSAANAGVKAIENIAELPVTSSSGWLSGAQTSGSLFGSVKSVLAKKLTGQEAQTANVMFAGLGRNLATLETAGLSPGGSLTHSLENLQLGEGDTQMTKLRKLAEMRQIVEENLSPNLSNPKLAPAQKELIHNIIDKVTKAVPFTQHDITGFESSKNPKATIMDFAKSSGVQDQADKNAGAHPADIQSLIAKYGK